MKNTYSTSINATALNSYILSVVKDNYSSIVKYDSVADYFIEKINIFYRVFLRKYKKRT
jgi:hypothetical protein